MVDMSSEEAAMPMLQAKPEDDLSNTGGLAGGQIKRWSRLPHYSSRAGQLCLAYLIYALCPGIYWNIFSIIPDFQSVLNRALIHSYSVRTLQYALPALIGFSSGILINKLSPRHLLLIGCIGYPLKVVAYLCFEITLNRGLDLTLNRGFVAFASITLAICQGVSGSVLPYMMLTYPAELFKGRSIGSFHGLWSLYASIGAIVSLTHTHKTLINYYLYAYDSSARTSGGLRYVPFLVLPVLGIGLSWFLVDFRRDPVGSVSHGSKGKPPPWSHLALALWRDVFANPYMVSLFPMFFVSTWFYGYQFAQANSNVRFNQRAQATNLVIYWATSLLGSLGLGAALDTRRVSRKLRARFAWLMLCLLTIPIWSGGSVFQSKIDLYINNFLVSRDGDRYIDVADGSYFGPAVLFLFYGLHSAVWQVTSYWIIGCLTNDDRALANYAGFYNAAQSAGNAVIWRLVSPGARIVGLSTRSVFDAIFALTIASLLIAAPTFFLAVQDVPSSSQPVLQSDEPGIRKVASPDEDAVGSADKGAVALPRAVVQRASTARWYAMPEIATCISCTLVTVVVLLPVGLASLGTLVNTGGSEGCLPDGTFKIPGNFDIWDPQYILTLTVGSGHMTFAIAKLVDLIWDIGVGHGGQALLTWLAYKVLTRYIVCLMERQGVTTDTYTAVAFHTGTLRGAWLLSKDLFKRKTFTITRNLVMMFYIGVYLLIFPVVISAMTSYAPIGDPFVTLELGNGSAVMQLPFGYFSLVNETNGTWLFNDRHYQRNFSTATILKHASCIPTNSYQWGFSYLLLFIICVLSSVFTILLVMLKDHNGLARDVHPSDCHAPGLWRAVMDLSSHARSITAGEDTERLTTDQLEQKLDGTRMAFNETDLAAIRSTVAAAVEASRLAAEVAKEKKNGPGRRAKAVWRRRKQSKGFVGYESSPAAYEGV